MNNTEENVQVEKTELPAEEVVTEEVAAQENGAASESVLKKRVKPLLGYGLFFGVLALAVVIGLIVCL